MSLLILNLHIDGYVADPEVYNGCYSDHLNELSVTTNQCQFYGSNIPNDFTEFTWDELTAKANWVQYPLEA